MAGGGQKTRTGPRADEEEEEDVERLTGEDGVDEGGGGQEDAGEIGLIAGENGDSLSGCWCCC